MIETADNLPFRAGEWQASNFMRQLENNNNTD
jgi:hypothetical protein